MNISTLKRVALATTVAAFIGNSANALTYTAIASGNFSSSTTWSGGNTPPNTLIGDIVIIPSGITVTLDQNQQLNGTLSNITVNGTLASSTTSRNALVLTAGSLAGNGMVDVDSMVLGLTAGFGFTGTINADRFTSMGSHVSSNASIVINSALELRNSDLDLGSGNLSLTSGATIVVSGGTMSTSGGMLSLTNDYNVIYRSNSANSGVELTGAGLNDVEINVPSSSSVTLNGDLTIDGTLTLTSGTLNTNNNDLFFIGNADFSNSGSGTISAGSNTSITITSANNFGGGLRFSSTGNTINDLNINMSNSSSRAMLASDLTLNGDLNLQAGRMDIGSNDLTVNGNLNGGSSNSYIITGNDGQLILSLGAGGSNTYYIGTDNNYAPAIVAGNNGSATGMVGVGVNTSVFAEGTANNGADLGSDQPLVDATWHVTSTATANIDLNLETMWSSDMEVNGFDRTMLYLSHYTSGNWDVNATASATTEANGMFSTKRNNITSLSPFAVMGQNANTTDVKNVLANNATITVYPNPAVNSISVNGNYNNAKIYDLNGKMIKASSMSNNSIIVSELPAGVYTILLNGDNGSATSRFVKQ
ncbi:MAG: T9SS type A sorting domain-containing protein [Sphingobacteriales bacterium]|nr:MAG: T9SS type A sorting domain-containing protein [Sphingobacteriales bacterium]